ncbi:hypothetical protein [Pseudochryseolinea flava]|uniref:Uncharacterized protein n=1 Tax=Pseudochryseolinea flava TaxID=2059302 RepID=A0A364XWM7_9BACT|nr:hypothetical protein [Pseudochryseolinea flava]RAV97933.1 hypothetical protein DQQ10_26030 [Pseudochryseolinea flava]
MPLSASYFPLQIRFVIIVVYYATMSVLLYKRKPATLIIFWCLIALYNASDLVQFGYAYLTWRPEMLPHNASSNTLVEQAIRNHVMMDSRTYLITQMILPAFWSVVSFFALRRVFRGRHER